MSSADVPAACLGGCLSKSVQSSANWCKVVQWAGKAEAERGPAKGEDNVGPNTLTLFRLDGDKNFIAQILDRDCGGIFLVGVIFY